MTTAVHGQSVADSTVVNDEEGGGTTLTTTTCGVTRLQNCIRPLTSYLAQSSVDEMHVLFPVYSHKVLDTVCRSVNVTFCSHLLPWLQC